jgi:hypothetical protein
MYNRTLPAMISAFVKNKDLINAHIRGQTIEGINDVTIMGLSVGAFLISFLLMIGLWIWGLVVLIQNWVFLPPVSQIFGVFGLLVPSWIIGPIITLIAVYAGKRSALSGYSS